MALGYLWGKAASKALRTEIPLPLLLTAGAVPDYDILLQGFGLRHHSWSHSLAVWAPIGVGLFVLAGVKLIPFFIGVVQHFAFGDFLVSGVPLFLPLLDFRFGLDWGMPSAADAYLEIAGLALMLMVMAWSNDLKRLWSPVKVNLWSWVPLATLVGLSVFASLDLPISLVDYAFSRRALTAVSLGHVVFAGVLLASAVSGFTGLLSGRKVALPTIRGRPSRRA